MQSEPAYRVESVDHALRLAVLLQQEGSIRVKEAAERLGVAPSTAHRLLAMLVYREFAEQDDNRCYRPGKVLRQGCSTGPTEELRRRALPHIQEIARVTGETTNLMVRTDDLVRFVATVEGDRTLHCGDREGRTLPAHASSVGLVLLAALPEEQIHEIYAHSERTDVDVIALIRNLRKVRQQGFALNNKQTKCGLVAIGHGIYSHGQMIAGVSVTIPSARYDRSRLPATVAILKTATVAMEGDLRDIHSESLLASA
jgi:IclR family acetate operon transcriptional repressor